MSKTTEIVAVTSADVKPAAGGGAGLLAGSAAAGGAAAAASAFVPCGSFCEGEGRRAMVT